MPPPIYKYQSISAPSQGLYKAKGSKFLAYLYPVSTLDDVQMKLASVASIHPKSRHLCYAYRLGIEGTSYRYNDDGEPSGSAGRPIYHQLLSHQVSDVICAVVRYYGGTKLGLPGLIKAYQESTIDAFLSAQVCTIVLKQDVHISFPIEDTGKMYHLLKQRGYEIVDKIYDPSPAIIIQVSLDHIHTIKEQILADYYGYNLEDITADFESKRIKVSVLH